MATMTGKWLSGTAPDGTVYGDTYVTADIKTALDAGTITEDDIADEDKYNYVSLTDDSGSMPFVLPETLVIDKEYTFSAYLRCPDSGKTNTLTVMGDTTFMVSNTWDRYSCTFNASSTDFFMVLGAGTVDVYHPMLEIGNMPSDYDISPLDIGNRLMSAEAAIKVNAHSITLSVTESKLKTIFGIDGETALTYDVTQQAVINMTSDKIESVVSEKIGSDGVLTGTKDSDGNYIVKSVISQTATNITLSAESLDIDGLITKIFAKDIEVTHGFKIDNNYFNLFAGNADMDEDYTGISQFILESKAISIYTNITGISASTKFGCGIANAVGASSSTTTYGIAFYGGSTKRMSTVNSSISSSNRVPSVIIATNAGARMTYLSDGCFTKQTSGEYSGEYYGSSSGITVYSGAARMQSAIVYTTNSGTTGYISTRATIDVTTSGIDLYSSKIALYSSVNASASGNWFVIQNTQVGDRSTGGFVFYGADNYYNLLYGHWLVLGATSVEYSGEPYAIQGYLWCKNINAHDACTFGSLTVTNGATFGSSITVNGDVTCTASGVNISYLNGYKIGWVTIDGHSVLGMVS